MGGRREREWMGGEVVAMKRLLSAKAPQLFSLLKLMNSHTMVHCPVTIIFLISRIILRF